MSTSFLRLAIVSLFVCAQFAVGCGDDDDDDDNDFDSGTAGNTSGSGGHAGTSHAGSGGRSGNGGSGGSSTVDAGPDGSTMDAGEGDELTDEEILAVLKAANTGEIGLSMLALERSDLGIVRTFSETMITDHGDTQQRLDAIADRFNLEADDNPLSEGLSDDVAETLADLTAESDGQFNLQYAIAQVEAHEAVLKLINESLLPSVTNSDLKEELEAIKTAVEHHLELARDLRDAVEAFNDADAGIDDDAGL